MTKRHMIGSTDPKTGLELSRGQKEHLEIRIYQESWLCDTKIGMTENLTNNFQFYYLEIRIYQEHCDTKIRLTENWTNNFPVLLLFRDSHLPR